ncbi:MAG: hypothetical protein WBW59_05990, partial [Pseudolabrys sp.]
MAKAFGLDAFYADPGQISELVDDPRLRDHLPSDAKEQVERAWKRWGQTVRSRLESGTRLEPTISVPVKVRD